MNRCLHEYGEWGEWEDVVGDTKMRTRQCALCGQYNSKLKNCYVTPDQLIKLCDDLGATLEIED